MKNLRKHHSIKSFYSIMSSPQLVDFPSYRHAREEIIITSDSVEKGISRVCSLLRGDPPWLIQLPRMYVPRGKYRHVVTSSMFILS